MKNQKKNKNLVYLILIQVPKHVPKIAFYTFCFIFFRVTFNPSAFKDKKIGSCVQIGAPTAEAMEIPGQSSIAPVNQEKSQKASRLTHASLGGQTNRNRVITYSNKPVGFGGGWKRHSVGATYSQPAEERVGNLSLMDLSVGTKSRVPALTVETDQVSQSQALDQVSQSQAPDSVKTAEEALKNLDVSGPHLKDNPQELLALANSQIKETLNAHIFERMADWNEKLDKNWRIFWGCKLKAGVFGNPTVESKRGHVKLTFKISTRGSESKYYPLRQAFGSAELKKDLKTPILLEYPFNPSTGELIPTEVEHTFEIVKCDVDHLHVRPTKEALGQINEDDDHKRTDLCEARGAGSFFHTLRTKFPLQKRSASITYNKKNGVFLALAKQQAHLEEQITDCYYTNMAGKATQEEKELFRDIFLETETLEDTIQGYRQLYYNKVDSLKKRSQEWQENGLLVADLNYARNCIYYKLRSFTNTTCTSWRRLRDVVDRNLFPDNLNNFVEISSVRGLGKCHQHLSFMKDALSLVDNNSEMGREMMNFYVEMERQIETHGERLIYLFHGDMTAKEIADEIKIYTTTGTCFTESMTREQKLERLNQVAKNLNCRAFENKEHGRLFPGYLSLPIAEESLKNCDRQARNPTKQDFTWLESRKTLLETDLKRPLEYPFSTGSECTEIISQLSISSSDFSVTAESSSSNSDNDDNPTNTQGGITGESEIEAPVSFTNQGNAGNPQNTEEAGSSGPSDAQKNASGSQSQVNTITNSSQPKVPEVKALASRGNTQSSPSLTETNIVPFQEIQDGTVTLTSRRQDSLSQKKKVSKETQKQSTCFGPSRVKEQSGKFLSICWRPKVR